MTPREEFEEWITGKLPTAILDREPGAPGAYFNPFIQIAWEGWLGAFDSCVRAVCGYCADPENWYEAKKGTYPEWWHLSRHGFNVRNGCSAWAIHSRLEGG